MVSQEVKNVRALIQISLELADYKLTGSKSNKYYSVV
jgi:hypothetical protein